jgi:DNA-binding beta-propeller fold protein YncE
MTKLGGWASVFLGLVATVACSPASGPSSASLANSGPSLQPSRRLERASLFRTDVIGLPTGASITPDAAPGSVLLELDPHVPRLPGFRAGGAVSIVRSPDSRTLLVLTSGYNRSHDGEGELVSDASTEWVFVYDLGGGGPRQVQAVPVANAFGGIAFGPAGDRFYVGGGSDDVVREYVRDAGGHFGEVEPAIALGHRDARGLGGLGIHESPYAAGVAVTASGSHLVVANLENDSITWVDLKLKRAVSEVPLSPGGGQVGGEFPYWVSVVGETTAYVSCQRDREVVQVDLGSGRVARRIPVGGQPTKMMLSHDASRLFVANANSDSISVVSLPDGALVSQLSVSTVAGAGARLRGSNPNDVALSPDGARLFVTLGGNNAVAVFQLGERDRGGPPARVGAPSALVGLIPTGFYPNAVTVDATGRALYVANGKSPTGPNPRGPWTDVARSTLKPYSDNAADQYSLALMRGGLQYMPVPDGDVLANLTRQVMQNNRVAAAPVEPDLFRALRAKVKHVIYVIGENRTYDQILGDLTGADGDPTLVHWGEAITPNQHALARDFVALDRFFDSGGVSGDGWEWSTSGRTTDVAEKAIPVEYAGRGSRSYDWEGMTRNVNVGLSSVAERMWANPKTPSSPDLLPGPASVGGVDEPDVGERGLLWDVAIAAGVAVRNYGFYLDDSRYGRPGDPAGIPALARPYEAGVRVAYATRPSLLPITDPYFRGFDMAVADLWRFDEWEREFSRYVSEGELPGLELVRLPHDHLGSFLSALDGVNTPDTQLADHDYALGRLVERVSKSPFWEDTVIVAIEDDAQNGSDHVDAHRSLALFAGGHVRRGARIPTVYTTPSLLKTLELLLGLPPLGQNDAFAQPMSDVFSLEADDTPYEAIVPGVLRSTELPLPAAKAGQVAVLPRGTAETWALLTEGLDFTRADGARPERLNRALFCELVDGAGCASEAPLASCAVRVAE